MRVELCHFLFEHVTFWTRVLTIHKYFRQTDMLYFCPIFLIFGVREWSKNAPGTRTIIFPVSIPHIVHSRSISSQFRPFRPSPILCISARQRMFFFCNKKIQSKSFISPLWRISSALGHEKSVQSYPNRSHRNYESSNVFEK